MGANLYTGAYLLFFIAFAPCDRVTVPRSGSIVCLVRGHDWLNNQLCVMCIVPLPTL